ncbi:MAG: hypothetical protein LBD41_05905 [Clostridiales Family XIII bacterium]|jgi:hypothetical protein|nr:hypothetical protein [Clostridiales Family XIII bacterium]
MQDDKQISKWNITEKRFIVYLDILGFKDRVMRESHDKLYNDLVKIPISEDILNSILDKKSIKTVFGDVGIHYVKFSDSIIIFSKNDTIESFIMFLIVTRFVFGSILKKNFLVKGGMAYGTISLDKENQVYFGQPLIDAYLLEEDVNYIGIVAHNSIDEFKQNIKGDDKKICAILNQLIFEGKSHLKSGLITHLNLNWFSQLIGNDNLSDKTEDEIKNEIIKQLKKYYLSVSGSPRRYIDNTIECINNKNNMIDFNKISLTHKFTP